MQWFTELQAKIDRAAESLRDNGMDVIKLDNAPEFFVVREDSEQGRRQLALDSVLSKYVYDGQTIGGIHVLICPRLAAAAE
jgi:hypothetical protein